MAKGDVTPEEFLQLFKGKRVKTDTYDENVKAGHYITGPIRRDSDAIGGRFNMFSETVKAIIMTREGSVSDVDKTPLSDYYECNTEGERLPGAKTAIELLEDLKPKPMISESIERESLSLGYREEE